MYQLCCVLDILVMCTGGGGLCTDHVVFSDNN